MCAYFVLLYTVQFNQVFEADQFARALVVQVFIYVNCSLQK